MQASSFDARAAGGRTVWSRVHRRVISLLERERSVTSGYPSRQLTSLVAAGLLIAAISGLPRMLSAFAGCADDCAEECDGGFGTQSCPPNCNEGPCAKVLPTALTRPQSLWTGAEISPAPSVIPAELHGAQPGGGIFHPPRA